MCIRDSFEGDCGIGSRKCGDFGKYWRDVVKKIISELPEHWAIKKLDELCDIARGGSPRPIKQYLTTDSNGINWIKIADASASSKYIYETKEKIKPEGISKSRLVQEGDFLLSNSMSFGRPYIMRTSGCIHAVSYTHLRAHETSLHLVCRLLL